MKKKLICLLTIFSLFLAFFAFAPITLKAAEENPVISSNQAVDTSSSQLVDGTGYFKKTDTSTKYEFYYTNYLGTDVDCNTNTSLYVRTINRSVTPDDWYNSSYGLDLDNFESISIINGKWALPHEYAKDEKGVIIPESTGYLEESIYSDCRRYVYYLVYVNEDGVQRPKFDKHYECNVEIDDIPEYLLNNGKNEKMGIQEGKIYNTSLLTYQAVTNISYYATVKLIGVEDEKTNVHYSWHPIIYFNLNDIDYDFLLSVKYSFIVAQYNKTLFGGYKEKKNTRNEYFDEVFFDESITYISESDSCFYVTHNDSLSFLFYGGIDRVFKKLEIYYVDEYKLLEKGSWTFDDAIKEDENGESYRTTETYINRIVGHSFLNDSLQDIYQFGIPEDTKNAVNFLQLTYTYNGVLYASDDNVIINGDNQGPGLPSTSDNVKETLDNFLSQLGNGVGTIIDGVGTGLFAGLKAFWASLSGTTKTIIIIVIIIILLSVTSFFWLPMLQGLFIKDDRVLDQSFRMYNNQSYNRNDNRRNRRNRRQLKQDRKYEQGIFFRNKVAELESRKYYSDRVDKKYEHEENMQEMKNLSFEEQRRHEEYMQNQQFAENEKSRDYWKERDKNKQEFAERKYRENSLWRRFMNKQNKAKSEMADKYSAEQQKKREHERYLQDQQIKEKKAVRKYWNNQNKNNYSKKTKNSWFDSYMKEEKRKMKKIDTSSSESLDELNNFFNKKK